MVKKSSNGLFKLGGVIFVVFLLGLMVVIGASKYGLIGTTQTAVVDEDGNVVKDDRFCSDNPKLDLESRLQDYNVETSTTYLNTTYYIVDVTEGTVSEQTQTTAGSAYSSISNAIKCGHEVKVYVKTDQDNENTALVYHFKASDTRENPLRIPNAEASAFGSVVCRMKDLNEDAYIYVNLNNSNTVYHLMGSTAVNFSSTTENTSMTLGASDTLDVRLECKTDSADKEFGTETLICFDYIDDSNSNDWEEPTITYGGSTLADIKGDLSDNDKLALTAYETCHLLPKAIGDTKVAIGIEFIPGSGVNPDYNIGFRFVGKGLYSSIDDPNTLIEGFFRDDSSRTEMASATASKGQIDIS